MTPCLFCACSYDAHALWCARGRLVRGTGEIIERIVSRDQQREINRRATQMDGLSFQASLRGVIQPPGR